MITRDRIARGGWLGLQARDLPAPAFDYEWEPHEAEEPQKRDLTIRIRLTLDDVAPPPDPQKPLAIHRKVE